MASDGENEPIILGKGSYGWVEKRGDMAVKNFSKCNHLIQEYAAGLYLYNYGSVVTVYGCDLKKKTMSMELFQGSLRDWLQQPRTEIQKLAMVKEILFGLIFIHDLGLVHGDLKPGNVVANWNDKGDLIKVCIADLGFVASSHHCKAERTAPIYREMEVERDFRHDIYSLGVICLEAFGNYKLKNQKTSVEIEKYINDKIEHDLIREYAVMMIKEDRTERPTARRLLWEFFELSPDEIYHPGIPSIPNNMDKKDIDKIENFFRKYSDPKGMIKIMRPKIGFKATIDFINKEGVPKEDYHLYSACVLFILSAMFGRDTLTVNYINEITKRSSDKIYQVVYQLLRSEIILLHLFY